ncbi:dihydroorotase [Fibrobacterales bacterium]|nr:dihydroorotase [Fibrobacterales bacterium]
MKQITIPLPDDFHIHLRQGDALREYAKTASLQFGRVLAMPNTVPPLTTPEQLKKYREEILDATSATAPHFEVYLTFKLNKNYSENELTELRKQGAIAAKYYPFGVTTNSQDGIKNIEDLYPTISLLEKLNFVLCLHGEEPNAFCLDREKEFLKHLSKLAKEFPNLRIVLEHISSAEAAEAVLNLPATVAATITVHHLILTLDDIIGDSLMPHHFCKPLPKFPKDRDAVRAVAFSGNPKFFLGTDSAPHTKEKKECCCGAAGVYSAPVAIPILITEFENAGKLELLENFVAGFGADFYGLPRQTKKITYIKENQKIPETVDGSVPLYAGTEILYSPL